MLSHAGKWSVDDPQFRLDACDWWLRTFIELDATDLSAPGMLRLQGLGGLADLWVNEQHALRSDNMFLAHRVDWRRWLQAGTNMLYLRIGALDEALKARRPRPRWRAPMVENQQLRWFRQTLLGRTPGWSPPAPPLGAWRGIDVELPAVRQITLESVHAGVENGLGIVRVSCRADADAVEIELARGEARHRAPLHVDPADPLRWHGTLTVERPDLWWPHTHGEPALYSAQLKVERRGLERLHHPLRPIGLRSVAVDTTDGDFALSVNGVPVFCRGACWMPLDPLGYRTTAAALRAAVGQVRAAGMNMLRISGATVYEDDAFFDACDAEGVLVWQEFMFASMDYPADDSDFETSVQAEVRQQLARWQGRPSVVVVCGNSEVESQAAAWGAARDLWQPPLFHDLLKSLVQEGLPGVHYWPSSACGGALPLQSDKGTSSYYGVGAYRRPPADARRASVRFATECLALSNVPEPDALLRMPQGGGQRVDQHVWKARVPRDRGADWDFEDIRDHYLSVLFGVDPARVCLEDHERYLALSRCVSGDLMADTFAEWRRPGSPTRGALVWTLRDIRAGAGWGLLDEMGRPKSCWHPLRRVLQPTALLLTDEGGNGLHAHVVHDPDWPLQALLKVALFAPGDAPVGTASQAVSVAPRGSCSVPVAGLFDGFHDLTYSYRFGPPGIAVVQVRLEDPDGALLGEAFHFPAGRPAARDADSPMASACLLRRKDGVVGLRLQARGFAQAVSITLDGFDLSDNYFHMAPGAVREVQAHPCANMPTAQGFVRMLNSAQVITLEMPS